MKLKERITSKISPAQFPRKPSTARSASLYKGTNECAPCIPKRSASFHKVLMTTRLIYRNAKNVPWAGEEALVLTGDKTRLAVT